MAKSGSIQCEVKTQSIVFLPSILTPPATSRQAGVENVEEWRVERGERREDLLSTVNILHPVRARHPVRNVGHVDT